MANAWAQCSWSIHAIRLLRRGAYQYAHSSSTCEIPDALMHAGICLSDARSCDCGRNINRRVGLRLLCFALQVLVKPRQHTLTHSCWDRCGNAGMCAYWVTSGRGVCVRVCHDWVFFFFCTEVQSLVAHVLAVQPVNSLERTKIQQFVAEVDLGGKVDGKHSKT